MEQLSFNTRAMIFTLYGDYIRHYGNVIWIGSLIRLMEAFGQNEQAVRAAVSRMSRQGWIQAERAGNKSYYSLTTRGRERMEEASRRIYKMETAEWDGRWRMLIYSIPEEKRHIRDALRKELAWSGFGLLASSCWITPNPLEKQVNRLVEQYDIASYVSFFNASYEGMETSKQLVEKCWDLTDINDRFAQFIHAYSHAYIMDKSRIQQGALSDEQCFVKCAMLVHQYRKFLFVDPNLPRELLPDEWFGDSAATLFTDYYQLLAERATRFFETIFNQTDIPATVHPFK